VYGNPYEEWLMHLQARLFQLDGMKIDFDDIDDNLKDIWEYLSDEKYNPERANTLLNMNIQVKDPYQYNSKAIESLSNEFL
jgi:lipoprotein NlpI